MLKTKQPEAIQEYIRSQIGSFKFEVSHCMINKEYSMLIGDWNKIAAYFILMSRTKLKQGGIIDYCIKGKRWRRNKVNRKGEITQFKALTSKISKLIQKLKTRIFASHHNPAKAWEILSQFKTNFAGNRNALQLTKVVKTQNDLKALNNHLAKISCNVASKVCDLYIPTPDDDSDNKIRFSPSEVIDVFRKIKKTLRDPDDIPKMFVKFSHLFYH